MNDRNDFELSVQDIKELIGALHKNRMGKLRIKSGEFELELESQCAAVAAAPALAPAAVAPAEEPEPELSGNLVLSPIVGTFYEAPAPDKAPYVKVGSQVKKGDVLFIIESMKLMNEVTSEYSGTVAKVLVENGQPVEYGQPILCIE